MGPPSYAYIGQLIWQASDGKPLCYMWYVCVLKSNNSNYKYIGSTNELNRRVKEHNDGICKASSPYKPFGLIAYIAVENKEIAIKLEKYLKTGSGKAFLAKRIL